MAKELNLEEVRGSLAELSLTSVVLGDYLMVMKSDFDVFIDGEPYLALALLLNTKAGVYKLRLWSHTILTGDITGLDHFIQICKGRFSRGKPCIGFPSSLNEQESGLLSHTLTLRRFSKLCLKFVKNQGVDQCYECEKMNLSKKLTDVSVQSEYTPTSNFIAEDILTSPKQEQEENGGTDSQEYNDISQNAIEDSPVKESHSELDEGDFKMLSLPSHKDLSENAHSKVCPWCQKSITWFGEDEVFKDHRQACLNLVLKEY